MKYTREEVGDFIKELKNFCISINYCEECPFYTGIDCPMKELPEEWVEPGLRWKIVSFDFTKKEDRDALIGSELSGDRDSIIEDMVFFEKENKWYAHVVNGCEEKFEDADELYNHYRFKSTGKRAGKVVLA